MMLSMSSVASMKAPDSLPGVSDDIFIIFRPTKAFLNIRNKKISGRIKSDNVVACRRQTTGARYCIRPMEYTGNRSTKVVHFEPHFEGEEVVLALFV